jgi:hypothetical protein
MIFVLISVVVPLGVYLLLPPLLQKLCGKPVARNKTLILACVLFFVSWYLPSPQIHGNFTAATTHFVGGGVFTGLLWLYIKQRLGWNAPLIIEVISLLGLVSILGVVMELAELTAVELGLFSLPHTDTSWDLLMNTLGAILFGIGYAVVKKPSSSY